MTEVRDLIVANAGLMIAAFREPAITAYNRLEPRARTEDFTRSLRAEVRDPLWLVTRQWQMGELEAEDAASPIDARLATRIAPFDRVSIAGGAPEPYAHDIPLEVAVEREAFPWSLPSRVEAGSRFIRALPVALRNTYLAAARGTFPIVPSPDWAKEPDALAFYRVARTRGFDGEALLASHRAGTLAADLGAPAADSGSIGTAGDAAARWRERLVGEPSGSSPPRGWLPDQLAYDVRIATSAENGEQAVLDAPRYVEGRLDWYAFDAPPQGTAIADPAGGPPVASTRDVLSFVPTAATFPGMPNPRFWELEDRRVNFGSINAKTTDHLLLVFAELGLIFGNDWFVVPYEMPVNHLCEVEGLVVTDVFGDRTLIDNANGAEEASPHRWSMFAVSGESADPWRGRYFWLPASLTSVQQGEPIEAVSFARDEMANLAWAVEDTIPDGAGSGIAARLVADQHTPGTPPPAVAVRYTLGTEVPENWVPLLPVHIPGGVTDIRLQRGTMPPFGTPPVPPARRGVILNELPAPFYVAEEEVPASGVVVTRRAQRTRWYDGRTYLWMGRARETGRGEASSGLRFDQIDELPGPE
jgi:hypothetical protein